MKTHDERLQADINRQVESLIPHDAWRATVTIVIANRPGVYPLGTGSLFEIGGYHFVVTAGHVVKPACEFEKTIAISDGANSFVSVHGNWITSASIQFGGIEDPFDLAVYRLPTRSVERLKNVRFLRREDIDFAEQSHSAVYTLFGYPGLWTSPSRTIEEIVSVKPLEYTTYGYEGPTESLLGYNPRYHFALDADDVENTQPDGSPATFAAANGRPATWPRDLKGISGCAVWRVGDLNLPLDRWNRRHPKLVGVETGIYQDSKVIRATRWIGVTTLIHEAFPELRPSLLLWAPD